MCGIAGVLSLAEADRDDQLANLTNRMLDAQRWRGPDGRGLFRSSDEKTVLGHVRLAVIDPTSEADQPFSSEDGLVHIVYNGEIYNYQELRSESIANGARFRTNSDTEVVLDLYRRFGPAMLTRLRGMFSMAILDEEKGELFLARDSFGIKPMYYSLSGSEFLFASQVRALLAAGVPRDLDPAGQVGFLLWGHVPDPYTMFSQIRALPAGTWMLVTRDGPTTPSKFLDIAEHLGDAIEVVGQNLRSTVVDSVRSHLVADVPVGVFLSSGIDSTVISAVAGEVGGDPISTITLGFPEFRGTPDDETVLAAEFARSRNLDHTADWITRSDFEEEVDTFLTRMDQPTIEGLNTFFVARSTSRAGLKVALSGAGGDELFGGYTSFQRIPRAVRLVGPIGLVPGLGKGLRMLMSPWVERVASPKWAGIVEYGRTWTGAYLLSRGLFMPWELERHLDPTVVDAGLTEHFGRWEAEEAMLRLINPNTRVAVLEATRYLRSRLLRDSDWAGMAHSLEIRVPFVDTKLGAFVMGARAQTRTFSKHDLALVPQEKLPLSIVSRPKTGFSIPIQSWAAQSLGAGPGICNWARYVSSRYLASAAG